MVLRLRNVIEEDVSLLFEWVNSKDVRKNALNPEKINWDQHVSWFKNRINNPHSKIFILEKDKVPIGQIRYDKNESNIWDIDVYIHRNLRGFGLGKRLIELSLDKIPGSARAMVKKDNVVSCKVFEKLGFQREEIEEGIVQYIFR